MPKITPSEAKKINARLIEHFETYPDHNFCAVTPDGQIFHADEENKDEAIALAGKKGLHDAKGHAKKRNYDSVVLVGKGEKIEANAEEPVEVKLTKVTTKKLTEEEIQAAAAKKAAELEMKAIKDALKKKDTAKAVELYGKASDETKALLDDKTKKTLDEASNAK